MTRDTIKTRIAKLLAKAEGTDNVMEADAFMAKVNELLEEHQIELHEVRAASGVDNDPMGTQKGETNIYASILWARNVAGALARYYGCRFVYWKRGNHFTYEVAGRESARTTFELMLPFVISQVKVQARRLFNEQGGSLSVWEREVGQALLVRLFRMTTVADERRSELSRNALVPVNDVDTFFEAAYPNLKKAKAVRVNYGRDARDAADKVSLHVQASGTGRTKLLA